MSSVQRSGVLGCGLVWDPVKILKSRTKAAPYQLRNVYLLSEVGAERLSRGGGGGSFIKVWPGTFLGQVRERTCQLQATPRDSTVME